MDIRGFLADKELLTSLSREFELLKKTGEGVDYDQWIQVRLREAATKRHHKSSKDPSRTALQTLPVNHAAHSLRLSQPQVKPPRNDFVTPPLPSGLHSFTGEGRLDPVPSQFISVDPSPSQPPPSQQVPRQAIHTTAVLAAASERERCLALSAALARQQISLMGSGQEGVAAFPLDGGRKGELKSSEYQHVLNLVKHLAEQNEKIANSLKIVQASAATNRENAYVRPTCHSPGKAKLNQGEVKELPHALDPEPWFVAAARGSKSLSKAKKGSDPVASSKERDRKMKKEKLKASLKKILLGGDSAGEAPEDKSTSERMILALKRMAIASRGVGAQEAEISPPIHIAALPQQVLLRPQTIDPSMAVVDPPQSFRRDEDPEVAMEAQVQQIVQSDKQKKQEEERLKRIDTLEERMSALLSRFEKNQAPPPPAAAAREPVVAEEPQLGLSEMQQLLLALEHMEDKEEQIRQRWFESKKQGHASLAPSEMRPEPSPDHGAVSTLVVPQLGSVDSGRKDDPLISDEKLERVMEGRERFLRHQRIVDGDLVASGMPVGGPTSVVEDLVDSLIEEMLLEEATRMMELCDDMGEELYEQEFDA